jgi:hypothetical protein
MIPATVLLAIPWLAADSGAAASTPELAVATARLEVRAAADCTSRGDLLARVGRRSPRIRFVEDGAAVAIRATLAPGRAGGMVAELVLSEPGEKPSSRRLIARSCAEAADGLALIIAVTLDPTSALDDTSRGSSGTGTTGGTSSSSTRSTPSSTAQVPVGGTPDASASPKDEPAVVVARPTASVAASRPSASAPPIASRGRLGADVAALAISGPGPALMPGLAVYAIAALDRDSPWSPAIVVGAMHAWRAGLEEKGGKASFTLDAASLDACAVRWRASTVEARGCATVLAGFLSASGSDSYSQRAATRPFASVGLSAAVGAYLGEHVELSARLSGGWNLVRDSFEFAPNVFYRTAPQTVSASLGVGARLP